MRLWRPGGMPAGPSVRSATLNGPSRCADIRLNLNCFHPFWVAFDLRQTMNLARDDEAARDRVAAVAARIGLLVISILVNDERKSGR